MQFQSIRCFGACAVLLAAVSAQAATIPLADGGGRRGAPVAQGFLETHGENVGLLATSSGVSCVASQILPIAEAVYLAPDGSRVDFADVTRSPASSIQAVARPDSPVAFRVQLKYSPDTTQPITLDVGGRTLDVAATLEASSDSLWLSGDAARRLSDALRRGDSPALQATSETSGRQITDRILSPDLTGLDACLVTLEELLGAQDLPQMALADPDGTTAISPQTGRSDAELHAIPVGQGMAEEKAATIVLVQSAPARPTLPVPVTGLRIKFVARPDPATRIAPGDLKDCRMSDIPENVYLGRLSAVSGFFSQTQDVYVAFDDAGQLQRAYIPGIFDSVLSAGTGSARVSLAADTNLPDQPNTVKGCLGDALIEAPICTIAEEGSDRFTIAECGVLGMSETRQDVPTAFLGPEPDLPGYSLAGLDMNGSEPFATSMIVRDGKAFGLGARGGLPFGAFGGASGGGGTRNGGPRLPLFNASGAGFNASGAGLPDFEGTNAGPANPSGYHPELPFVGGDYPSSPIRKDGPETPPGGPDIDIAIVPLPAALGPLLATLTVFFALAVMMRRRKGIFSRKAAFGPDIEASFSHTRTLQF